MLAIEDEDKRHEEMDKLNAMRTMIGCHTIVKKGTVEDTIKTYNLTSHTHICNFMDESTSSVIRLMKITYFVIILLSQTVVRILSQQPFFYTVHYSFLPFYIFPHNRKISRPKFYGNLTFKHNVILR